MVFDQRDRKGRQSATVETIERLALALGVRPSWVAFGKDVGGQHVSSEHFPMEYGQTCLMSSFDTFCEGGAKNADITTPGRGYLFGKRLSADPSD